MHRDVRNYKRRKNEEDHWYIVAIFVEVIFQIRNVIFSEKENKKGTNRESDVSSKMSAMESVLDGKKHQLRYRRNEYNHRIRKLGEESGTGC